jgi:hypothetical protein
LCTEPDPDPDSTIFFCGFPGEKKVSSYKTLFFYLKGLSHAMDLAFDDMHGQF